MAKHDKRAAPDYEKNKPSESLSKDAADKPLDIVEIVEEEDEERDSLSKESRLGQGNRAGMRMGFMRGGPPGGKPKNFKKAVGSLFGYLGKSMPALLLVMFMSVLTAAAAAVVPVFVRILMDVIDDGVRYTGTVDTGRIFTNSIILVAVIGTTMLISYIRSFIMAGITHKTAKRLRTDINAKINRLPLSYFDVQSYGDVLSRITNDVDTIGQSLNNSINTLLHSTTLVIGLIVMMFITSWSMALIAVTTVPVSFVLIFIIVRYSQKHFKNAFKNLGQMNGHIEEIYSGHEVVLAYGGQESAKEQFEQINDRLYTASFKGNFLSSLMFPMMNFIANLGLIAVGIFGAAMFVGGRMGITPGTIVAFILFVRLFANSLPELAQVASNLQSAAAASERVFEFLGQEELESEADKPSVFIKDFKGQVEFKNVEFSYKEGKKVINDFSVSIAPGQKVAIVGPTGAGKTTLVNLLMRFYETCGGDIFIDGVSIKDMTRAQVHSLFGMVLQDTWLFEGTVKENIAYAKANAGEQEIRTAAENAGVDHFIRSQPKGYDMVLNESVSLSAGQKQLITIARAIVENAPMLILDEATSAVDTRTEVLIQAAMDKLTKGRTSFIIAHRLSTIKNADIILVMRGGDIVEQGSHEQLMQAGGFYSELYSSQFERV